MPSQTGPRFAICISDAGYIDDLKPRTVYQVRPDESAAESNYLRVVDETGEDYFVSGITFCVRRRTSRGR